MLNINERSVDAFFQNLDASFAGVEKELNQPYVWQANDFLVQTVFQLPIPVVEASRIRYKFSTEGGDISFESKFLSSDTSVIVTEKARVDSDSKPLIGEFVAHKEGTFVLSFDNTYSWFNSKNLSYHVELLQPVVRMADATRCLKSRNILFAMVEETKKAEASLGMARQKATHLKLDILHAEEQIAKLLSDLNAKKQLLTAAFVESEEMSSRIVVNLEKANGLCIRLLSKPLLTHVLEYLGGTKSSHALCASIGIFAQVQLVQLLQMISTSCRSYKNIYWNLMKSQYAYDALKR